MRTSLLAALALAACAHDPGLKAVNEANTTLAAAETAFADHSVREGMRRAFLAHFADDGVFVRSGWIVSNDYLSKQSDRPILLEWRPQFVEAAGSGDLGLSTGPSRISSKEKPSDPPGYGQYVSVWRREGSGPWRVAVDLGIAHPKPDLWDQPLVAHEMKAESGATGASGLAAAESAFAKLASVSGLRAAHEAHGAERLRFYRPGLAAIGKAASLAAPGMNEAKATWSTEKMEASKAGDFGYARGTYADALSGKAIGSYLRVWRFEGGRWCVVMEVTNPWPKSTS